MRFGLQIYNDKSNPAEAVAMRYSNVFWSCAVVFAFGSVHGSRAMKMGYKDQSTVSAMMKVKNLAPEATAKPQGVFGLVAPTVPSAVTVSCPKITHSPSLVERKLGSLRWDVIHEGMQGQISKRDWQSCGTSYTLCPKSLNGGCCPTDHVCGASSCFPTSVAPASACGQSGYIACGLAAGGTYKPVSQ